MLKVASHLVPNVPRLLVAGINTHAYTHTCLYNLTPQRAVLRFKYIQFFTVRTTITVFSLDSEAGPYLCVSNTHTQTCTVWQCSFCAFVFAEPVWSCYTTRRTETLWVVWILVCLHTAVALDCPAPARMNWLAKLQALWMSWLYLSNVEHTVCLSVPFENEVWNATNVNQN